MNLRALHLLDTRSVGGGPCVVRLLVELHGRLEGIDDDVLLLGGLDEGTQAQRLGLECFFRLAPPAGRSLLAATSIRRFLRRRQPYSLIHAWSPATFSLAALFAASTPRLLMQMPAAPTPATSHWLRMLLSERPGEILAGSNTVARALKTHGVPEKHLHVLRPGLHFGLIDHNARSEIRQGWGVEPETKVVALVGEPAGLCDAWRASWVLTILRASGVDAALVVSPRAHRAVRAWERVADLGWGKRMLLDGAIDEPWKVLPGCDAVLFFGDDRREEAQTQEPAWRSGRERRRMPGMLPLLWAMAAGVPIVGEASYAVSEILEHQHSALLVQPDDAWGAARALHRIFDDAQMAWRLRDSARSESFSFFSRLRFCDQVKKVYEQIAEGYPVRVEDLPVTGGVRFGRP